MMFSLIKVKETMFLQHMLCNSIYSNSEAKTMTSSNPQWSFESDDYPVGMAIYSSFCEAPIAFNLICMSRKQENHTLTHSRIPRSWLVASYDTFLSACFRNVHTLTAGPNTWRDAMGKGSICSRSKSGQCRCQPVRCGFVDEGRDWRRPVTKRVIATNLVDMHHFLLPANTT